MPFLGSIQEDFGWDKAADFIGQSIGLGIPFKSYPPTPTVAPMQFDGQGVVTADGGSGDTPGPPTEFLGTGNLDSSSLALHWFEMIHILPRTKIEFGNIITQVEDSYEIYNAFRLPSSSTENAITNNVLPGVTLPDNTPPVVMPPLTSILDSSTTGQTTSSLGTLVPARVVALADGLPTFDGDIVFEFTPPANDVTLFVSGTRIVLIPYEYEDEVQEDLVFPSTNVIPGLDGKEQRINIGKNPRQIFKVRYKLDELDRQRMQALLFDWTASIFGFPLRHERLLLTSAISAGATTYPVSGADDIDLRLGGLAAIITDPITFDVINIIAPLNDTTITAASPSINAYPAGSLIMPVRTSVVQNRVKTARSLVNLEQFDMTFEVIDNDTGAPTGDVTPGFWSTHNGRVLFDDCNVVDGTSMPGDIRRRIHRIDNQTGKIEISSIWDRSKKGSQKGFLARNREEILALRKLFIGLFGKQKAFYLPTFAEELTVNANLVSTTNTMDIDSIGYVRFVRDRLPMSLFRITFTDDTSLVRTVTSSATVSISVERLTLNTTWPVTRTPADISRIEWYDLTRFDSDKMSLIYKRIGQARTTMPILSVFDDN